MNGAPARPPRISVIVGARPQFVKVALLVDALTQAGLCRRLIHTGQHYDPALSAIFFTQLGIPEPEINLGVGSAGDPAEQTARLLLALAGDLAAHRPDLVLVFGDTNSTLAGALAAAKLGLPLAHVEAGLRSHNRAMPEEHNRVLTDHLADLLFCHHAGAARTLAGEGVAGRAVIAGDTMREAVAHFGARARAESPLPASLGLAPGEYAVLTVHRPVNADDPAALGEILSGADALGWPVVFPVHPRTRRRNEALLARPWRNLRLIEPAGYLDLLALAGRARLILTDSGGLQKEALFLGVPCLTLRGETEWTETLALGGNLLAGDRPAAATVTRLARAAAQAGALTAEARAAREERITEAFGPLDASRRIAAALGEFLASR